MFLENKFSEFLEFKYDKFDYDSLGKSGDWDNSIGGNSWLLIVYKGFKEYTDS